MLWGKERDSQPGEVKEGWMEAVTNTLGFEG